jgi:hypothetical protein
MTEALDELIGGAGPLVSGGGSAAARDAVNVRDPFKLPLDWTIKTGARFTSEASFAWTRTHKPADVSNGLAHFVHNAKLVGWDGQKPESLVSERLRKALMYYKHPDMAVPASMSKIMGMLKSKRADTLTRSEMNDLKMMEELQRDWSEAFESAYTSMRNKHCPYFYVQTLTFTALFAAPGVRGSAEVSAVVSHSTTKLRQSLKNEMIPFDMPLSPDHAQLKQRDLEEAEELAEIEVNLGRYSGIKTHAVKVSTSLDGKPKSMLTFVGHDGVHGLYEFLLNRKYGRNGRLDLPTLLSPTAFQNATLKSIRTKYSGTLAKIGGNLPQRRSVQMNQALAFELDGPILPHSYHLLHELFEETQDGQYNGVYLSTDSIHNTVGINSFSPRIRTDSKLVDAVAQLEGPTYGMPAELASFLAHAAPIGARSITKTRRSPDGTNEMDLTAPQAPDM